MFIFIVRNTRQNSRRTSWWWWRICWSARTTTPELWTPAKTSDTWEDMLSETRIFFLNPVLLQSSVTLCVIFCIYFIKFHCLFFWYVQYSNTCDIGHKFLYYCGMVGFGCWLTRGSCNIQILCVQLHTSSDLSEIIMCTCSEYEFYLCILRWCTWTKRQLERSGWQKQRKKVGVRQ